MSSPYADIERPTLPEHLKMCHEFVLGASRQQLSKKYNQSYPTICSTIKRYDDYIKELQDDMYREFRKKFRAQAIQFGKVRSRLLGEIMKSLEKVTEKDIDKLPIPERVALGRLVESDLGAFSASQDEQTDGEGPRNIPLEFTVRIKKQLEEHASNDKTPVTIPLNPITKN